MNRKNEKVPEFDDIIFENRNKIYGAYDLRKRYKSATSLSILGGVAFCAALMTIISILAQNEVSAKPDKNVFVIIKPDSNLEPDKIKPPEPEKSVPAPVQTRYIAPDVVSDSVKITDTMMTNDFAIDSVKNGVVTNNDTVTYVPVSDTPVKPDPFIKVEEMPVFPGGDAALLKYIAENLRYPAEAIENNIQGKVILRFVVTQDGSVDRIEILRGINILLDEEAIRVVSSLPKWKPGKQNGKPVPVWFFVPVSFKIKTQE
ncbi:MAG: TonB family protein [Bacteroidia bacterium]|nr:TonB family protein [Bacteroidia bacterium]